MSFTLRPYDELKQDFLEIVLYLRGHHRARSINDLPDERRSQIQFLQTTIAELDKTDLSMADKANILSGALFVIREKIESTYTFTSPTRSVLFEKLTTGIGISPSNQIEAEDKYALAKALIRFLRKIVFVDGQTERGMCQQHPYFQNSPTLTDVWKLGADIIANALKDVISRHGNEFKAQSHSSAVLGLFGSQTTPPAQSPSPSSYPAPASPQS